MTKSVLINTVLWLSLAAAGWAQAPPVPVQSVIYSNIRSTSTLDGYGYIDNRSQFTRQSNYHAFRAYGTGTWQVEMFWADTNTSWTSYGSTAIVSNSSPSSAIGYGIDPSTASHPYHDFIKWVFTGNVTIQNYFGTKNAWWTPSVAGISFPITVNQGGTHLVLASPDGTTNNTTLIQTVISAFPASGGAMYFPEGTYALCHVAYSGTGSVLIYGDGKEKTRFVRHSSCLNEEDDMFTVTTTGSFEAHDLGIDVLATNYARSGAVNTSGTAVTWVSGDLFASYYQGAAMVINSVSYTVLAYVDPTHVTLSSSAGVQSAQAYQRGAFTGGGFNIVNATKVTVARVYVAHAGTVGVQCTACSNVQMYDNRFFENYWFAVSVANGNDCCGGTATPNYLYNYNFHGNIYENQPIGLGLNFFVQNIQITGETFYKSNLSLVQTPHAKATISGITINGVPTFGCVNSCGFPGTQNALFLEGVADVDISNFFISNISSIQGGILCQGSTLTIPTLGTTIQLPCSNVHIHGGTLLDVTAGFSIILASASTGGTIGTNNAIKNVVLRNVNQCPIMSSTDGFDITGNSCETSVNGGYSLSSDKNGSFRSNRCRNCKTGAGTYAGLLINGAGTLNLDVFDNIFENDGSATLGYPIRDDTAIAGNGAQIRHFGNKCSGSCGLLYSPAPVIPTAGTWQTGALFGDVTLTGALGETNGWVATTTGVGVLAQWVPLSNLPQFSDGSYKVARPGVDTSFYNWGTDATGTFSKSLNTAGSTYIPHRVESLDFSWKYGPTGVEYFKIIGTGTPSFSVFGGSGKRPICTDNAGALSLGTNTAGVAPCP